MLAYYHDHPGWALDVFRPLTIVISLIGCLLLTVLQPAEGMRLFRYINEEGETVISNVPPDCVKNARLTCMDRHPVSVGQPANPSSVTANSTRSTGGVRPPTASSRQTAQPSIRSKPTPDGNTHQSLFDRLDQVVEMNRLLDEYYPGAPDPDTAAQVKAQQRDIMDVLQTIRRTADSDDQPIIDRAIDVFRANISD